MSLTLLIAILCIPHSWDANACFVSPGVSSPQRIGYAASNLSNISCARRHTLPVQKDKYSLRRIPGTAVLAEDFEAFKSYSWISNRQIMFFLHERQGDKYILTPIVLDTITGQQKPYRSLTFYKYAKVADVSSDGTLMLVSEIEEGNKGAFWVVRRCKDGYRYPGVKSVMPPLEAAWIPGTKEWMEYDGHRRIWLHSLKPDDQARKIEITGRSIYAQHIMGVTRRRQAIFYSTITEGAEGNLCQEIIAFDLSQAQRVPVFFSVIVNASRSIMSLSPTSDAVVMTEVKEWQPADPPLILSKVVSSDPKRRREWEEILIWHRDTNAMQRLGWLDLTDQSFDFKPKWTPDGRQISFLFDNSLWVMPVPQR